MLSVGRIGWEFDGAFKLVADCGVTYNMTDTAPGMLQVVMQKEWRRQTAEQSRKALGLSDADSIPDPSVVRELLASPSISNQQRGAVRAFVSQTCWSSARRHS